MSGLTSAATFKTKWLLVLPHPNLPLTCVVIQERVANQFNY